MPSVCFKIDGEFICNLARQMLWDEGRSYSVCEELILSCLGGAELSEEELKLIVVEILEGRKILKGLNDFCLIEDNKNVRPLSILLMKQQKKIQIEKLKDYIDSHPLLFVDRYATCMSTHKDIHLGEYTKKELIWYLMYGVRPRNIGADSDEYEDEYYDTRAKFNYEAVLQGGTYLIQDPAFTFKILGGKFEDRISQSDLERQCTLYWNSRLESWKEQGLTYDTMDLGQQHVYNRQFKACPAFKIKFPYAEEQKKLDKIAEALDVDTTKETTQEKFVSTYDNKADIQLREKLLSRFEEYKSYTIEGLDKEYVTDNRDIDVDINSIIMHIGTPDKKNEYVDEFGWISPDGTYYSCGFGGHSCKARNIVKTNKRLMEGYLAYIKSNNIDIKNLYSTMFDGHHTPVEYLFQVGWCEFHNPSNGYPYPSFTKELTQKQLDCIFDVTVKYKFPSDPVTGKEYNWEKFN